MHFLRMLASAGGFSALSTRNESESLGMNIQGCTPPQENKLTNAMQGALYCLETVIWLRKSNDSLVEKELRVRYFGNLTDVDEQYVSGNLTAIKTDYNKKPFRCSDKGLCAGKSKFEAYMDTSRDEIIYCSYSLDNDLRIPLKYEDRAMTLIHELSHSSLAANITEEGSGEKYVQQLAFSEPEVAAKNPDNYSLYARDVCIADKTKVLPPAAQIDRSKPSVPEVPEEADKADKVDKANVSINVAGEQMLLSSQFLILMVVGYLMGM